MTTVDPLRFYLIVIRDVFLKSGGVADHWGEMGMMVVPGGSALVLSALRLR